MTKRRQSIKHRAELYAAKRTPTWDEQLDWSVRRAQLAKAYRDGYLAARRDKGRR